MITLVYQRSTSRHARHARHSDVASDHLRVSQAGPVVRMQHPIYLVRSRIDSIYRCDVIAVGVAVGELSCAQGLEAGFAGSVAHPYHLIRGGHVIAPHVSEYRIAVYQLVEGSGA